MEHICDFCGQTAQEWAVVSENTAHAICADCITPNLERISSCSECGSYRVESTLYCRPALDVMPMRVWNPIPALRHAGEKRIWVVTSDGLGYPGSSDGDNLWVEWDGNEASYRSGRFDLDDTDNLVAAGIVGWMLREH